MAANEKTDDKADEEKFQKELKEMQELIKKTEED